MGTTATFLACRAGAVPAVGQPWTPLPRVAEGWMVCESRLVPDDLAGMAAVLRDVSGPAVIAFVMFSDDCWLMGALDGAVAWEWSFGDEYDRVGGLAAVANDPSVDLDALLATRMRAAIPRIVAWAAAAGLGTVTPDRLEAVLERGYIFAEGGAFALLAALGVTTPPAPSVDADTEAGDGAIDLPAGEVTAPPSAPAACGSEQGAHRADPATILVAIARIANAVTPPGRARPRPLHVELDTYEDLLARGDAVADWLQAVRAGLVDPVIARPQVRLTTRLTDGPPYGEPDGMALTLVTRTVEQRLRFLPGDPGGWARLLDQVRQGRLREVEVGLEVLDGEGIPRGAAVRFEVVARDQFVDDGGPLPDHHPARVLITLSGAVAAELAQTAVALAKQAASRLGAVTGFVTAGPFSRLHDCSPYEEMVGDNEFRRPRLDRVSRGVHWGTFFSARHLELLGGVQALRDLGLFHGVERLAGPPEELVWVQLTRDPYEVDRAVLEAIGRELAPVMPRSSGRGRGIDR
jgi:hypothetical protein